jgi:hypothetical protein
MLCIHCAFTRFIFLVHEGVYELKDKKDNFITFENFGWGQIYLMITMIAIRFFNLILMAQVRTQNRQFVGDANYAIFISIGLYVGLIIEFLIVMDRTCSMVFGLFVLDVVIFAL